MKTLLVDDDGKTMTEITEETYCRLPYACNRNTKMFYLEGGYRYGIGDLRRLLRDLEKEEIQLMRLVRRDELAAGRKRRESPKNAKEKPAETGHAETSYRSKCARKDQWKRAISSICAVKEIRDTLAGNCHD